MWGRKVVLAQQPVKPDFLIIGAQKSGTTWLWEMLAQHPGTSLPKRKEIHFFGSAELYRNGTHWYYEHFKNVDATKVVGEASTTYLYDRVPYWRNPSHRLEFDPALPSLPEIVTQELPAAKIIAILRDPVSRAISAYRHWMQRDRSVSPFLGLKETAIRYPKMRILEFGHYAQHLKSWLERVPPERMRLLVFEDDVVREPEKTLREIYRFLGLDADFRPREPTAVVHPTWSWTRILLQHVTRRVSPRIARSRLGAWTDKHDVLGGLAVRAADIEFLQAEYLPQKPELERLLNRSLDSWQYGREWLPR
jgi:hypothetical protein